MTSFFSFLAPDVSWLLFSPPVPLPVQRQVVAPGEPAPALPALEGLGAGVLPEVAGQLVRAGEAPVAAGPRAKVRLLTWNEQKRNWKLLGK